MLQRLIQHHYFVVSLSVVTGLSLFSLACVGERVRKAQLLSSPAESNTAKPTPHAEVPLAVEQAFVVIPEDPVRARQLTAKVELAHPALLENSYILRNVQRAMRHFGEDSILLPTWTWAEAAAIRGSEFVSLVAGSAPSRQTFLPFAANWSEQMGDSMAHITAALSASVGADLAANMERTGPVEGKISVAPAAPSAVAPSSAVKPALGGGSPGVSIAALPPADSEPKVSADPSTVAGSASSLAAYEDQELNKMAARGKWHRDDLDLIFQDTIDVARADDAEATAKENSSYALCMIAALAERGSFADFRKARDQAFDALERDGTRGRCTAAALAAGSDHIDARSSVGKWTKRQLAWMTKRCARDAARAYASSIESEFKSCECLHNSLSHRLAFGELMQMDEAGFARLIEADTQLAACL